MPRGWAGVMHKFNLDGYGLTLVDANGIVRGVNIHAKELKKLMKKLYPKTPKPKKGPKTQPKNSE